MKETRSYWDIIWNKGVNSYDSGSTLFLTLCWTVFFLTTVVPWIGQTVTEDPWWQPSWWIVGPCLLIALSCAVPISVLSVLIGDVYRIVGINIEYELAPRFRKFFGAWPVWAAHYTVDGWKIEKVLYRGEKGNYSAAWSQAELYQKTHYAPYDYALKALVNFDGKPPLHPPVLPLEIKPRRPDEQCPNIYMLILMDGRPLRFTKPMHGKPWHSSVPIGLRRVDEPPFDNRRGTLVGFAYSTKERATSFTKESNTETAAAYRIVAKVKSAGPYLPIFQPSQILEIDWLESWCNPDGSEQLRSMIRNATSEQTYTYVSHLLAGTLSAKERERFDYYFDDPKAIMSEREQARKDYAASMPAREETTTYTMSEAGARLKIAITVAAHIRRGCLKYLNMTQPRLDEKLLHWEHRPSTRDQVLHTFIATLEEHLKSGLAGKDFYFSKQTEHASSRMSNYPWGSPTGDHEEILDLMKEVQVWRRWGPNLPPFEGHEWPYEQELSLNLPLYPNSIFLTEEEDPTR